MTFIDDEALGRLLGVVAREGAAEAEVLDDRYELGDWLGEGGMGAVYAAWDREAERDVAIKRMTRDDTADRARFEREVEALSRVQHPALLGYLGHGTAEGASYLVTERLFGTTLAERLPRGPLSVADTVVVGRRLAGGLAALHAAGLVHRDVKPSNVFLCDEAPALARLIDFGLTLDLDARTRLTATGALLGTPGYMAPEQVRGDEVGPEADVFGLGCVIHECLVGAPAFEAEETEVLLSKLLLESPPSLAELRDDLPEGLAELVARMLDKRPEARPSAGLVAERLEAFETSQPTVRLGDEPAPEVELASGAIVGEKYEIRRRLGGGGMGVVYEAQNRELDKAVAIKVMRRGDREADELRFLREARATSRLEGEHVRRVLDVGRMEQGAPFMVMELLRGRDLAQVLAEDGPLPIAEAVGHVMDACEALAEAHGLGIVHRDLKPSNLFVARRRGGGALLKVLDFGISKVAASRNEVTITEPEAVIGSAAYMSPEQLKGAKHVDARSDLWSLGVVLYELCTGELPFTGTGAAAVGARIATEPPAKLREARPDAPVGLEAIVERCLAKDPDERFADVEALAAALAPYRGAAVEEMVPSGSSEGRRSVVPLLVVGALGLLGLGMWWRAGEAETSTAVEASAPAVAVPPRAPSVSTPTATPEPLVTSPRQEEEAAPPAAPSASAIVEPTAKPAAAMRPPVPRVSPPPAPPGTVNVADPALSRW
ncbi:MAG: serine/threonine protein kinase [Myxococcales bacterium]|nr:serine/threonine protein kinase [Myxococcales bacterium]